MRFWRMPLDAESQDIPVGELFIIPDRCKECGFCVEFCPNLVLVLSPEFNKKGYHPPVMRPDRECNNCGICEVICPEFAIYSTIKEKRRFNDGDLVNFEERLLAGGKGEKG